MNYIILLLLLPIIVFAQERHFGELVIQLTNEGTSWDVTFTLTAIGARWDDRFELTEEYYMVSDNINSNLPIERTAYFDHILDNWTGINPIFAIGLYKISAIENGAEQAYFYCDWRTSDGSTFGDLTFRYDIENKHFRDNDNLVIIDHSYQTIWDLLGGSDLETSGLEDYWNNCLAVFNNGDDHPKFAFGPFPQNLGIYEYRIYRDYGGWDPIGTLNEDEFTYVDTLSLTPPGGQAGTDVYYYIKGVYTENTIETSSSNTVVINIPGDDIDKRSVSNNYNNNQKYNLSQNYPNPFNPTTFIYYSLPVSGQVTLKVFDLLGREVETLVDESRNAGLHTVEFNASKLSSGIYIYRIESGEFINTKKLILMK